MSNNEKQPVCCRLKPGKSLQAILIPLLITVIVFIFGANKTIYLLENLIDSLTTSREVVESTTPMNVLILYADDWRFDTLGIESNSLVKTPFLDAFAEEGIRFTRNCVTTSVCWVSRASFFTGQYLSRHNSSQPKYPHFYKHWNNQSFPGIMRDRGGYYVGHIGKWQFTDFDKVMRPHFDFARIYSDLHWYPSPIPGGPPLHTIDRNQKDAIEFLRNRPKNKPFLLTVAFFPPHAVDGTKEQYFPQNKTMGLYNNMTLKPPSHPNMSESWRHMPNFVDERNEGRNRWHLRFDHPSKYQHMLKNYYRLVSGVDAACRRIVEELKRQQQYDNTLIIFTADNGLYHGEHGLAGKWYPHQESIRIPLIIKDPRMPAVHRNATNDAFTLNVDLASTILSAANLSAPSTMQGRDISTLYLRSSDHEPWRQDMYYEHPKLDVRGGKSIIPGSTALVRKDFKYIAWAKDESKGYRHPMMEQLFDLLTDPKEAFDLAAAPAYFGILNEMRARHDELREWVKSSLEFS